MSLENVNTQIDKNLMDYINGSKNVLRGDLSLRKYSRDGKEYAGVYYGSISDPIHYGPNYKRKYWKTHSTEQQTEEIRLEYNKELQKSKRRGTGGKEAYTMLMTKNESELKKLSVTAKAILFDMCLGGIQWGTGKLVQNRSKKAHTAKTISDCIDVCEKTCKIALKELSDKGIIKYDKSRKFYFVSKEFARKGAAIEDENKV